MKFCYTVIYVALLFAACKNEGGQSTGGKMVLPNGYEYIVHTSVAGDKPVPGQMVTLDFELKGDDGTIMDDSRSPGNIPAVKMPPLDDEKSKRNPMIAMLRKMSAGDSVTIIVPADSIPNLPPDHAHYNHIEYVLKTHTIEEEEAYNARLQEEQVKQQAAAKIKVEAAVKEILPMYEKYAAGKYASDTRTLDNRLKITTLKGGNGTKPAVGDAVTVQYYGFLKDGTSFDNSFKAGRAFTFNVGQGMVIQGWDLGLQEMSVGEQVFLEIPYDLAYGDAGNPVIPAKSDLIFYIELEKIN